MKEKFSAGDLVQRFKLLKIGNFILICAHGLDRDTEKSRRWDEAADLSKQNWDMGTSLALGDKDPRPPPTTFSETKLFLGTYAALQDALLGEGLPFEDQVLALKKQWICQRCLLLEISGIITGVGSLFGQCLIRGSHTVGSG